MKAITVYCGSSDGKSKIFKQQAEQLGVLLAEQKITLIYGGAKVGMMGTIATSVLKAGGKVIGVIPDFLKSKEVAHEDLTLMFTVSTMHERKTKMYELCDGFIAMPGGFGTLEELFEMLTWAQLGLHAKPIGLLNAGGYYDPLIKMIDDMVEQAYLKKVYREMLLVGNEPTDLLFKMKAYKAPNVSKWIRPDEV